MLRGAIAGTIEFGSPSLLLLVFMNHEYIGAAPEAGHWCEQVEQAAVEAARHDPAAFGRLYEHYLHSVYIYVRMRTHNDQETADLTQQVFLQALDAIPVYQNRGAPLAAWLFRIARNTAINANRRPRDTVDWGLATQALE